jgi:hypothetical protein
MANLADLINELADTPDEMLYHFPEWVRILSKLCREARSHVNEDRVEPGRAASESRAKHVKP